MRRASASSLPGRRHGAGSLKDTAFFGETPHEVEEQAKTYLGLSESVN
jgi:hypothetical protein